MDTPVMIVGCGRSGTTMLLRLLGAHRRLAWPSTWMTSRTPWAWLGFASRCYDLPWLGDALLARWQRWRLLPGPAEAQPFWRRHVPGFYDPDAGAASSEDRGCEHLRRVAARLCAAQGKRRLLLKVVGLSRLDVFNATFGAVHVVHLVRDPRAVVCSMLQRWETRPGWQWLSNEEAVTSQWPPEYREQWQNEYPGRIGYLAFQWLHRVRAILEDLDRVQGADAITVRYEDLMETPDEELTRIMSSFGDVCPRVLWAARKEGLRNMNYKWRERLTGDEARTVERIVQRHGFERYLDSTPVST